MTPRRVTFITGATSGIGLSIARQFSEQGNAVFIVARDGEAVAATVKQLSANGSDVDGTVCDVTSTEDVHTAVTAAVERFGRIEVLVNNAGRGGGGETGKLAESLWLDVINTNLNGTFRVTKEVLSTGLMSEAPGAASSTSPRPVANRECCWPRRTPRPNTASSVSPRRSGLSWPSPESR